MNEVTTHRSFVPTLRAEPYFTRAEVPITVQIVDQFDTDTHRHDFTELVLVLDGAGDHVFDGRAVPICAGNAFVVDERHVHGYRNASGLRIANILFDEEALLKHAPALRRFSAYQAFVHLEPLSTGARERGLRLPPEEFADVTSLVRQLHGELTEGAGAYQEMAGALLVQILVRLCRVYETADTAAHRELNDIGRVVSYLENNYAADVTLADLEKMVAMSVRTLHRRFERLLRVSPKQYLNKVRVSHAARLLAAGTLSVSEIASAVGMPDSNYFSRQFRRFMHMSPTEYRRSAASNRGDAS